MAHIHRSVTAEAKALNTGESATQLQPLEFVRVTAELRNRHGRFAFQTHRSGPMLGTTGCTAMPTNTMAGERTGSQLKSHSPDLHKDCNTTRVSQLGPTTLRRRLNAVLLMQTKQRRHAKQSRPCYSYSRLKGFMR